MEFEVLDNGPIGPGAHHVRDQRPEVVGRIQGEIAHRRPARIATSDDDLQHTILVEIDEQHCHDPQTRFAAVAPEKLTKDVVGEVDREVFVCCRDELGIAVTIDIPHDDILDDVLRARRDHARGHDPTIVGDFGTIGPPRRREVTAPVDAVGVHVGTFPSSWFALRGPRTGFRNWGAAGIAWVLIAAGVSPIVRQTPGGACGLANRGIALADAVVANRSLAGTVGVAVAGKHTGAFQTDLTDGADDVAAMRVAPAFDAPFIIRAPLPESREEAAKSPLRAFVGHPHVAERITGLATLDAVLHADVDEALEPVGAVRVAGAEFGAVVSDAQISCSAGPIGARRRAETAAADLVIGAGTPTLAHVGAAAPAARATPSRRAEAGAVGARFPHPAAIADSTVRPTGRVVLSGVASQPIFATAALADGRVATTANAGYAARAVRTFIAAGRVQTTSALEAAHVEGGAVPALLAVTTAGAFAVTGKTGGPGATTRAGSRVADALTLVTTDRAESAGYATRVDAHSVAAFLVGGANVETVAHVLAAAPVAVRDVADAAPRLITGESSLAPGITEFRLDAFTDDAAPTDARAITTVAAVVSARVVGGLIDAEIAVAASRTTQGTAFAWSVTADTDPTRRAKLSLGAIQIGHAFAVWRLSEGLKAPRGEHQGAREPADENSAPHRDERGDPVSRVDHEWSIPQGKGTQAQQRPGSVLPGWAQSPSMPNPAARQSSVQFRLVHPPQPALGSGGAATPAG